ncbi:MAG: GNAT family N-acetyltransferase [Tissierellales bacterium]
MIETNRCILSKIQKTDYEDVRMLYTDEKVREFLGGIIEENIYMIKFINMCDESNGYLYWVIRHKEDNQFVGLVSLDLHHDGVTTEISYQLLPKWWGDGYATEIIQYVISYGFKKLGLIKIVAETQSANTASCRLLKRIGMSLEETVERFGAEQSIFSIRNTEII